MNKNLKKFLIASLAVGVINFSPVMYNFNGENLQIVSVTRAEISTYEAVGRAEFNFGENNPQLIEMAKNYARMNAAQAAKEKAGIYLKSFSRSLDGNLTDDDISVVASNSAEILNVKFKQMPYVSHDVHGNATGEIGIAYEATVTFKIDSDALSRYIKRDEKEKSTLIEQNKDSQKNITDINKQVKELENNPQKATPSEIEKINNEILARQKNDEGLKLYYQKNYQGAISKFTEAIQLNPNFDWAYNNRGNSYNNLKNYSQALYDLNQAIRIDPKNALYYVNRGITYCNLEEYRMGISNFNKAIEVAPNFALAYYNRGFVYYTFLKDYQKAIPDFTKTIELSPKSYYAYIYRGNVYYDLKNYSQALYDYDRAIEIKPNYSGAYNNRGLVYEQLENYTQAISDFSKAIELNPNDSIAYINRGMCYENIGEKAKARLDFMKVKRFRR